jgi:hypothetical protein
MFIALMDIDLAHGHSVLSHGLRPRSYLRGERERQTAVKG